MTDHLPLVHHVELWTDDLALAERQWGPVLAALGCGPFQHWHKELMFYITSSIRDTDEDVNC